MVQPFWKTIWQFFNKVRRTLSIWLSNPTLRCLPCGNENLLMFSKNTCIQVYTAALFHNCQNLEIIQMSYNGQRDKPTLIYPHSAIILLSNKKGRTMGTCSDLYESQKYYEEIKETVSKHSILYVYIYF